MSEETNLEKLAHQIEQAGKKWSEAKQISERLEELKKSLLAKISNTIEETYAGQEKFSEAKLERLARGSQEYIDHVETMINTRKITHDYFLEYEAFKNLFEARRSDMSLEKAKMNLL